MVSQSPEQQLQRGDIPNDIVKGQGAEAEAEESRAKSRVAVTSIAAAVVLTSLKLLVGILTGSLGLLSEAAHSGLDLLASVLTLFSVRIASRPADADHPYGHGRVENLSASIQGVVLLATAAGILYESVRRIFFLDVTVESTPWAFVVMGGSIVIDFWRSRMLATAAKKYHSNALEADALNFRADMFSSSVVILGLAITMYAEHTGRGGSMLIKADAVAAFIVGIVIIRMSGSFAIGAIQVMLDRAPAGLRDQMTRAAAAVPGVVSVEPVRVRESGSRVFADVVVTTPRTASLAEAHKITERVEAALRTVESRAEAIVHVKPTAAPAETAADGIRAVALGLGLATHHEEIYVVEADEDGGTQRSLEASLHLQVDPGLTLEQAHAEAHRLADAILRDNHQLHRVDTHIEAAEPHPACRRDVSKERPDSVDEIRRLLQDAEPGVRCTEVRLYQSEGDAGVDERDASGRTEWDVVLTCMFPLQLTVGEVHRRTEQLEQSLRVRLPYLGRVVIHAEPAW